MNWSELKINNGKVCFCESEMWKRTIIILKKIWEKFRKWISDYVNWKRIC